MFQPGEENGRGAASVVQSGAVDDLDAILGLHVDSSMPTGVIKMKSGPMSAANDKFKIWIEGVGCHGSTPQKGADAMLAMVSLAQSLQTVITRERSPLSPCVMTLGILKSGTAFNILPSEAYLEGSIRVLDEALREKNRESVRRMAECTAAAYRCTARCEFEATAYLVSNDKHLTELAWDAARSLAGEENLRVQEDSMGAEDFGAFMQVAPVTYVHVGTGNAELGTNFPHHHGRFDVDESALPLCAALYVQFACNVMQDAANQNEQ